MVTRGVNNFLGSKMPNMNVQSDSQESALLDDAVYRDLQSEIPEIDFLMEEKYSMNSNFPFEEQKRVESVPLPIPLEHKYNNGYYKFEILLTNDTNKFCMYSTTLNKVFIDIDKTLPLRIKINPFVPGLYLRAGMVFCLDQYKTDPVERCHNHMAASHRSQDDPSILKHVIRSCSNTSLYEDKNGHLSVITPLDFQQMDNQYLLMHYKFLCKNSCTSGMNRRPTEVQFTLEDGSGNILGQQKLLVRICSCPKRDMEKEEADLLGKRPGSKKRKIHSQTTVPDGKKLMRTYDSQMGEIHMKVPSKEIEQAILKSAFDIISGYAVRTNQVDALKPYLEELGQKAFS